MNANKRPNEPSVRNAYAMHAIEDAFVEYSVHSINVHAQLNAINVFTLSALHTNRLIRSGHLIDAYTFSHSNVDALT